MIQSGRVRVNLSLGYIPECPSLGTKQVSGRGYRGVGIHPGAHRLLLTVWAEFLISWRLQEYCLLLKFNKGIMKLNLKTARFSPSGKTLNCFASWVSIFYFFPLVLFLPSWFHKNFYSRNSEKETEASGFQFSSVQLLSCVQLFETRWTAARQAFLSITNSQSPPKPTFIESVMPSNHLILCGSLLLLPSMFPSIRVFSSESALRIRWPNYWSFSFNISPLLTLK